MAELDQNALTTLEGLLTDLGYDLSGHTTGQVDDVFMGTTMGAIEQLEQFAGVPDAAAPGFNFDALQGALGPKIEEIQSDSTFNIVRAAAGTGITPPGLDGTLEEKGLTEQFIGHKTGLVRLIDDFDANIQALEAFSTYATQSALEAQQAAAPAAPEEEQAAAPEEGQEAAAEAEVATTVPEEGQEAAAEAEAAAAEETTISDEEITAGKIALSALTLETFLNDSNLRSSLSSFGINLAAIENAGDAEIDNGTQQALQQLLGLVAGPNMLNIQGLSQNGVIVYTPEVGDQIFNALNTSTNPQAVQLRQRLQASENLSFTDDDGATYTGAEALKKHLDYLYLQQVLERNQIAEPVGPDIQLTQMQQVVIKIALGFVQKFFPSLIPMLDGMVRQFTDGQGILDLVPQLGQIEGVQEAIGGVPSTGDAEADLAAQFKQAFAEAGDAGERAEMESTLNRSAAMMSVIPFGEGERRRNYPTAVSAALADSLHLMGDIRPGDEGFEARLDEAAELYAQRFTANMQQLNSAYGGSAFDPNPEQSVDPTLDQGPVVAGAAQADAAANFDIDGNAALSADEINQVIDAYNFKNHGNMPYAHEPLLFTDNSGQVYIAGVERGSNMFTVQPMDVQAMRADYESGMNAAQLAETHPGYGLAMSSYGNYFNQFLKAGGIQPSEAVIYAVEFGLTTTNEGPGSAKILPFSGLRARAQGEYDQAIVEQQLNQVMIGGQDRGLLGQELARQLRLETQADRVRASGFHGKNTIEEREAALLEIRRGAQEELEQMGDERADPSAASQMNLPARAQHYQEFRELMQDDNRAAQQLASEPRVVIDTQGNLYGFSHVAPNYRSSNIGRHAFEANITDEMGVMTALSSEQRQFYQTNPARVEQDFPALTVIAKQYGQFGNAFDMGHFFGAQVGMGINPLPHNAPSPSGNFNQQAGVPTPRPEEPRPAPRAEAPNMIKVEAGCATICQIIDMPLWAQAKLDTPEDRRFMADMSEKGPVIDPHWRPGMPVQLIAKAGSAEHDFIAADVTDELEKLAGLSPQQKAALEANPEQMAQEFPGLSAIGSAYEFSAIRLGQTMMNTVPGMDNAFAEHQIQSPAHAAEQTMVTP